MDYPRKELLQHVVDRGNLCFNVTRQTKATSWQHALASDTPAPAVFVEIKDGSTVFPLYLHADSDSSTNSDLFSGSRPNISHSFLSRLSQTLGLEQESEFGLPKGISPEDIFHYIYAIFHAPGYRTRYAEFLKRDFPRVPLTANIELFRALGEKGKQLVALHLLKVEDAPQLDVFLTGFPVTGSNEVLRAKYTPENCRVWINDDQYFSDVPAATWNFLVGGYQVCEKWLKDRKGRILTYADLQHWQRVVVALTETQRLMTEIDDLIPQWPLR